MIQWFWTKFPEQIFADINDCMEEPCNNNGTCTDGIADYTCTCPLGYIGTDCEHSMLRY